MSADLVDDLIEPCATRAKALDRRMRERLTLSLRHILSVAESHLGLEHTLLNGFFNRASVASIPPLVFGAYFELVVALEGADFERARNLVHEIARSTEQPAGISVTAFSVATDRYRRLINLDTDLTLALTTPPRELAERGRRLIAESLQLLDSGAPAFADEIRILARDIVLAVTSTGSNVGQVAEFEGASSFMLWGAIVLNVRAQNSVLDMIQALVHESGHNVLFGLCADSRLVNNSESARFPSPLREDERPMDGIVHATYVSARMHCALSRLMESDTLSSEQRADVIDALAMHTSNFASGLHIIEQYGELTSLGRNVISSARRHFGS